MQTIQPSLPGGNRFLLWSAGIIIIVAGLQAGAPFLVPLVLAIFLTIINLPVLGWLRGHGVPAPIAVALVVMLTFGLVMALVWVGTVSLSEIRLLLPSYVERIRAIERGILAPFVARGIEFPRGIYAGFVEPERLIALASGFLLQAAGLVSAAFVVLLYTIFMLSEAAGFPTKVRAAIGRTDADLSAFASAIHDVQRYLAIKTAISLATGTVVGLWLWGVGVDFPLFWGTLAFLLNYIPNVGSILAAIPGVLVALLQLGMAGAGAAAIGYLLVNVLFGNILEPHVMGRGFGLSTLMVIIALVFWGWLWGPVGMLLSVPLTVAVRIALEHTPDLRWLAILVGTGDTDERTDPGRRAASAGEIRPPAGTPAPERPPRRTYRR